MQQPSRASRPPLPGALREPARHASKVLRGLPHLSGARILAAVSGGPDSVLLVRTLAALAPRLHFSVVALHVNHQLGPMAAMMQSTAERACALCGVECRTIAVNVSVDGEGIEAAARHVRRAALLQQVELQGAGFIATGHTTTDVAETFLQRLLEGAGRGQAVMPPIDGRWVRPLIALERRRVREIVHALGLPAIDDPMNDDETLLRGYLRAKVWPVLEQRFGAPDRTLARACQIAHEDHLALESLACAAWSKTDGLTRASARSLPFAVLTRALRQMVEHVAGGPVRTGAEAVRKAAMAALATGGGVRQFKAGPVWLKVDRTHVLANAATDQRAQPSDSVVTACYGRIPNPTKQSQPGSGGVPVKAG